MFQRERELLFGEMFQNVDGCHYIIGSQLFEEPRTQKIKLQERQIVLACECRHML